MVTRLSASDASFYRLENSSTPMYVGTQSHQALVNGMTALEIGHVIADRTQKAPEFGEDIWIPAREPSDARLLWGAVGEWITRPTAQLAAVRSAITEVATNSGQLLEVG